MWKLSSAAVVIGALRVKLQQKWKTSSAASFGQKRISPAVSWMSSFKSLLISGFMANKVQGHMQIMVPEPINHNIRLSESSSR